MALCLINLPELAALLRELGIEAIGGGGLAEVAGPIRKLNQTDETVVLVVADRTTPGLKHWLGSNAVDLLVILRGGPQHELDLDGAIDVPVPVMIDDLFGIIGLTPVGGGVGAQTIGSDYTLGTGGSAPETPPATTPAFAADPSPRTPEPTATSAAIPDVDDDDLAPWGDDAPVPTAPPAEPPTSPWDEPATPVEPAVVEDTQWDAPPPTDIAYPTPTAQDSAGPWGDPPTVEPGMVSPTPSGVNPWDEPAPTPTPVTPVTADPWSEPAPAPVSEPAVQPPAPSPAPTTESSPWSQTGGQPGEYVAASGFDPQPSSAPSGIDLGPWANQPADPEPVDSHQLGRDPAPAAPVPAPESPPVTPDFEMPSSRYVDPTPISDPSGIDLGPWETRSDPAPAPTQERSPAPSTEIEYVSPFDAAPGGVETDEPYSFGAPPSSGSSGFGSPSKRESSGFGHPPKQDRTDDWATAPWPPGQAPGESAPPNVEDLFTVAGPGGHGPQRSGHAPVIVSLAGKGGVGKSSLALLVGQRAAIFGDMRVIVIDANRGQGDLLAYLRLGSKVRSGELPTIYHVAMTGNPEDAILTPSQINAARHAKLPPVKFGIVFAPTDEYADPTVVTTSVYRQTIEAARQIADLVVIDTQIVEAADTSGLFDGLIIPMLTADSWAIATSDLSSASVENIHRRLSAFQRAGVPRDRMLLVFNRVNQSAAYDASRMESVFDPVSVFMGSVVADESLAAGMNVGLIEHDNPSVAPVLDAALARVTGNPKFEMAVARRTSGGKSGFRLFRGKKGRR